MDENDEFELEIDEVLELLDEVLFIVDDEDEVDDVMLIDDVDDVE